MFLRRLPSFGLRLIFLAEVKLEEFRSKWVTRLSEVKTLQLPLIFLSPLLTRCVLLWQVLCDVLRSGGYPGKSNTDALQPPVFFAADDFEYATKFPVPRFGMGAFRTCLETLYTKLMKRPLAYTSFGKPKPVAYHLASKTLHNIATMMSSGSVMSGSQETWVPREEDSALKTLYMIGDNPETDIAGAIRAGRPWFSILVRSGTFRGTQNHDKYPADVVVNDVYEAVDFILKREGVSTE